MKNIFLTSAVSYVAHDIPRHLTVKPNKLRLLFIDTAAEVETGDKQWLKDDRKSLVKAGFNVEDYTFTGKKKDQVKKDLENYDVLYMSGGNTFYLLQQMQKCGALSVVKELVKNGKIYIGTSAGSIIAGSDTSLFQYADNVLDAPELKGFKGLEFVDFTIFPHWGSEDFKDVYLREIMKQSYQEKNKIILLNNYQYVVVDNGWFQIVDVRD